MVRSEPGDSPAGVWERVSWVGGEHSVTRGQGPGELPEARGRAGGCGRVGNMVRATKSSPGEGGSHL